MQQQDYQSSIIAGITPKEAFDGISRVNQWWSTHFEGSASNPGDVFTVRFKSGDWFKIKIEEIMPDKKIVWKVVDAEQSWLAESKEWVGTSIRWEISPLKDGTEVKVTHLGLVPAFECYDQCSVSWDWLMQKSLTKLLTEGKGLPPSF